MKKLRYEGCDYIHQVCDFVNEYNSTHIDDLEIEKIVYTGTKWFIFYYEKESENV